MAESSLLLAAGTVTLRASVMNCMLRSFHHSDDDDDDRRSGPSDLWMRYAHSYWGRLNWVGHWCSGRSRSDQIELDWIELVRAPAPHAGAAPWPVERCHVRMPNCLGWLRLGGAPVLVGRNGGAANRVSVLSLCKISPTTTTPTSAILVRYANRALESTWRSTGPT